MAALPGFFAVAQSGRVHPDEVYQYLDPAYARAHNLEPFAWEWQSDATQPYWGLRNWAIPLALAGLIRGCEFFGILHPTAQRAVLEIPQFALHFAMLLSVYRFSLRRTNVDAATIGTILVGLIGSVLLFAGRTMGESFSTAFTIIAIEVIDRPGRFIRNSWIAGVLLGLAVVARYGSIPMVFAALAWLIFHRRWMALIACCIGGIIVALGLGFLDWWTWGEPFHSLIAYAGFNVFSDASTKMFESEPWHLYLWLLPQYAVIWAWPAMVVFSRQLKPGVWLPLLCAIVYFGAISITAHKEPRFLYPALILIAFAAAPGVATAIMSIRKQSARIATTIAAVIVGLIPLSFSGEMYGDQFRALTKAARPADVRGVVIVGTNWYSIGGRFYAGKNIPLAAIAWPADAEFAKAMASPDLNRAITRYPEAVDSLQHFGFHVIDHVGRQTILSRESANPTAKSTNP